MAFFLQGNGTVMVTSPSPVIEADMNIPIDAQYKHTYIHLPL